MCDYTHAYYNGCEVKYGFHKGAELRGGLNKVSRSAINNKLARSHSSSFLIPHSSLRHWAGFDLAALIACVPTVSHAIETASTPAPTKYHQFNSILKAKPSSHRDVI